MKKMIVVLAAVAALAWLLRRPRTRGRAAR